MGYPADYIRYRYDTTRRMLRLEHCIDVADVDALFRCAIAMHRWDEMYCNGEVEQAESSGDGANLSRRTYSGDLRVYAPGTWLYAHNIAGPGRTWYSVCKRPAGPLAEARAQRIVNRLPVTHNPGTRWRLVAQGDPRGWPFAVELLCAARKPKRGGPEFDVLHTFDFPSPAQF